MREGLGGTFNLTLLFFFILLVSSFALFATNYYRAFTVKNNIITLTEKYEANFSNSKFKDKRENLVKTMSYNIDESKINKAQLDKWECPNGEGWCYKRSSKVKAYEKNNVKYYNCVYTIRTFVSTDLPIINKMFLNTSFFEVNGKTKPILRRGGC